MRCARCQTINPDAAKFCINCGASLNILCPKCRTELPINAKFCFHCGQALNVAQVPPILSDFTQNKLRQYMPHELLAKLDSAPSAHGVEGERRIITMLFCDVKGSTGMAETLDPEAWVEIMNRVFEEMIAPVYRYEGTIARLMGDAILAFFGAPIAHEDDPQRAALAGLGIVEGVRVYREELARTRNLDFNVRVGINTGLVVVGEVGSDLRVEYTAMGDAVNLAARMEQTAQPGTVQISGNTAKLIAPLFELESLGGIEVKGKREPVPSYRVLHPKIVPGRLRGIEGLHSPLVGREREFSTLKTCLAALAQGRGQIISVIGEAGLGKSRLIAELRESVAPLGIRWYEGRSLSFQATTPYAPFIGLFTAIFKLEPKDSQTEKYNKIRSHVAQYFADKADEVAPFLATVLGVQPQGDDNDRVRFLEPPSMRMGIFQAVLTFIKRLALTYPLALIFEDLHWSDPTSLELLERLMALADSCPLLLLALFRPQRSEPSWRIHEVAARDYVHRYTSIALEPLDETDARTLVANLLQIEDLPEKVRALILRKSEGNPFFVEEVIRSLLDAGLVIRDGNHWRATREIADISLPDTLAGVITARLDRLDENSKRTAQTAAVIGREFQYEVVQYIYDVPSELDPALVNLQQRELIREKAGLPQPHYWFKHTLTHETAYNSLLISRRRELHKRVAECLVQTAPERANEIAFHFLEAQEPTRALPYLMAAGDSAAKAYSSVEAIGYYHKALEILKSAPDLALARRAYEGLGRMLSLGGDMVGASDVYHEMLHFAQAHTGQPMEVSARNKLAVINMYAGQFQELNDHLGEAERLARAYSDVPGLAELFFVRCMVCLGTADFNGAVKHLSDAVKIGKDLAIDEQTAFGLSHLANTMTYLTRFEDAWKTAQECVRLAEKISDYVHLSEAYAFPIPYYELCNGNLDAARESAEKGERLAVRIGYAMGEALSTFFLGSMAQARGEYEQALSYTQRSVRVARLTGYPNVMVVALGLLGSIYLDISPEMVDKVVEYHQEALRMLENPIGMSSGGMAWAELGFCALQLGNVEIAAGFFQKGLTVPTMQMLINRPRFLLGSACIALARGQFVEAANLVAEARHFAESHIMKNYFPFITLIEAQISAVQGKSDQALDQFAATEKLAEVMQMRPVIWQARSSAAGVLAAQGRVGEAAVKQRGALTVIDEIAGLFRDEKLRALYVKNATSKVSALPQVQ